MSTQDEVFGLVSLKYQLADEIRRLRTALQKARDRLILYADDDEVANGNGYGTYCRPQEEVAPTLAVIAAALKDSVVSEESG
jgi:ATP-dependent helicase YprA (DUF1998 family)